VIIEINEYQHRRLRELTDVYLVSDIPRRKPLEIVSPLDRIGADHACVDPGKVAGLVLTNQEDQTTPFTPVDEVSARIAGHVVDFLLAEIQKGNLPADLPPIQAGVGNIGNAVMAGFEQQARFPKFSMYTELLQESLVDLLLKGKLTGISAGSLAIPTSKRQVIFDDMDYFAKRIVLRPSEITNSPEVIRRLGVIALNTAIEFDIYGNVNSTHFNGSMVMNGIGGAADFSSNARLAIFMTPSMRQGGKISSVVPMCPHVDQNEHSVHVMVTEQGVADLRGLDPLQRAARIIDHCAYPPYRDYLRSYVRCSGRGHIPHDLRRCFELYANLQEYGSMLPEGVSR
jgi:acetyl-CoA hydrolase